jgi:hypothetical protein
MAMCAQCGRGKAQRDGRCAPCRLRALAQAQVRYRWTEELREELRAAYRLRWRARAAAVRLLMRKTGWPRHTLQAEAIRLGISVYQRHRAWTAREDELLGEWLGTRPVHAIARNLGRSKMSVESRGEKLRISRDTRDGYSAAELGQVFGVTYRRARAWMRRGLLGRVERTNNGERVAATRVLRFIKVHASEYDLRRVDQDWFKAVLFAYRASEGASNG